MAPTAIKKYSIQLLLLILIIPFVISSCNFEEDKDIEEIVTLLIKKSIEEDMLYSHDSLKTKERLFINGKFVVAVYKEMTPILNNFGLRKHQKEFKVTFEKLQSLKQPKKMNIQIDIPLKDVNIIDLTPELIEEYRKGRVYKYFHFVTTFSRIAIVNNTALVTYGKSSSSRDGTSYLAYLKKENGKWVLFDLKVLSIS